jgi:hypothetical protein
VRFEKGQIMATQMPPESPAVDSERANLYALIGDLLCKMPDAQSIAVAISTLEADRPPPELAMARALLIRAMWVAQDCDVEKEYAELFRSCGSQPFVLCSCTPGESTRVANVPGPVQDRIRHLLHLAMHADRYVHAMSESDTRGAIHAWNEGRDMLASHAGNCLFDFALWLQGSGLAFFVALGSALRELVERDLGSRRAEGVPSRRWLALSVQKIHGRDGKVVLQSLVRCPQLHGDAVALDCCMECGRWNGMQFGGKDRRSMILCRVDDIPANGSSSTCE